MLVLTNPEDIIHTPASPASLSGLAYRAEQDSILSWVVRHVEHWELGTTEEETQR